MSKPIPLADRVRGHVARRKAAGLIHAKVWVHPDEAGEVRKYAAKKLLTKAILKELGK